MKDIIRFLIIRLEERFESVDFLKNFDCLDIERIKNLTLGEVKEFG